MMRWLVFLIGTMLLSLGGYCVYLTRSIAIEQENNRQLMSAIEKQQTAINDLKKNYQQVLDINKRIVAENDAQSKRFVKLMTDLQTPADSATQMNKVNQFKQNYNKCVENISKMLSLESCSGLSVQDAAR